MKHNILVIIPIFNPDNLLFTSTIPMLLQQSIKPHILLISSGEKVPPGNYEFIIINKKDFNHANTRNIALSYSSDFYLFMTQDVIPYNNYVIERLLEPFLDKEVVVTYARQIPYENAHITEKFSRNQNYPNISSVKSKNDIRTLGIKTYFSSDSCALYKADYFQKQLGFTRDLNTSEDMEFAARAILDNKKIAYSAEAKVYHSHVYTIFSLYQRYLSIGKFFKLNGWIQKSIKETTPTEITGFKQTIEEFLYVISKEPSSLIKSFFYTLAKCLGYFIGKYS